MEQWQRVPYQTYPCIMNLFLRCVLLFVPAIINAQSLQLAPPQFQTEGVFFRGKTQAILSFDLEKASIHYTFSGTPTLLSPIYTHPITCRKSCSISAISTHPDYLPSIVTQKQFIKITHRPKKLNLLTPPHNNYPGQSAKSLFDLKKGSLNLHDGDWLGFEGDTVVVESFFEHKIHCKSIIISTLSDLNAWILPMRKITVFGENAHGSWEKIGSWEAMDGASIPNSPVSYATFQAVELQYFITNKIRLEIIPFGDLPNNHPGSGKPAWLFLDEIVFQ